MDVITFRQLLSEAGQRLLQAAARLDPTEASFLACHDKLSKHASPELVRATLETVLLRKKARIKFRRADTMYFTREALEMASSERVSLHRAERFRPYHVVGDFGCGCGADALALASLAGKIVAIERDELLAEMTRANAGQLPIDVMLRDVLTDDLPPVDALFADPGRRRGRQRFLSLADSQPPPMELLNRLDPKLPVAFKLAPGLAWSELEPFDGEIEFISWNGELKECVLWLNAFRTTRRRATVLIGGLTETLSSDSSLTSGESEPIRSYLYDPDAAVVRAGLVPKLGEMLNATPTDSVVQMLSAPQYAPTPFANAYHVETVVAFDFKRVSAELRSRGIGRITVVNRGSLADLAEVQKKWNLSGSEHRFVILTRELGRQVAVIAQRLETVICRP